MAFADTLANVVHDASTQILLVALVALAVAVGLSFLSRIAFWIVGGASTAGAIWIFASTSDYTLPAVVFVAGWIVAFVVRGMVKMGAVLTTLFAVGLFWLTGWADGIADGPDVRWVGWAWWAYGIAAIVAILVVLAIPTLVAKTAKGAVSAVTPGGSKKDEKVEAKR